MNYNGAENQILSFYANFKRVFLKQTQKCVLKMNGAQVYNDYFTVILQFLYIVFSDFYTISST